MPFSIAAMGLFTLGIGLILKNYKANIFKVISSFHT